MFATDLAQTDQRVKHLPPEKTNDRDEEDTIDIEQLIQQIIHPTFNIKFDCYLERVPEVVDGDEALLVAVERREALHVLADLALAQSDRDRLLRRPVRN